MAMTHDDHQAFGSLRRTLAEITGTAPHEWYLTFKARYGLKAIFAALAHVRPDAEVLAQALTCCTAVAPVTDAGLSVRYGAITEDSLGLDGNALPPCQGVVLWQHTFGISNADSAKVMKGRCRGSDALFIEDSAHCVGRMVRSEDGRPIADISVHSFGVQKMLPTRFGGAVWLNPELKAMDGVLYDAICRELRTVEALSVRKSMVARAYINENRVLSLLPTNLSTSAREALTRWGLYEPPVAVAEQEGVLPYQAMTIAPWMARRAQEALHLLTSNETQRMRNVEFLRSMMGDNHAVVVPALVRAGSVLPLLRFPVLLNEGRDASGLVQAMRATGVDVDHWGWPLLYPGVSVSSRLAATLQDDGGAARLACRLVTLPTDLPPERTEQMGRDLLNLLV